MIAFIIRNKRPNRASKNKNMVIRNVVMIVITSSCLSSLLRGTNAIACGLKMWQRREHFEKSISCI